MKSLDVYILFYVLLGTATIVVFLRLGVRLRYGLRRLFPEDVLIIFAWVAYVALIIELTLAVIAGLAQSTSDEFSDQDPEQILKMFFLHGYALYTCLWLVKFSIIAFYARLCWNTARTYRIVTYITYFILAASFVVVIIYKTFNCYPLPRVWDPSDQCTGGPTTEYTRTAYLMTTSLLDICTDIICLILPFVILRNLRIDLRKKLALGFLFAIALMSVVCSCIRLSAGLNHDTKLSVALWAVVEASTALCVASAPALRPLIFRTSYFSRGSSVTSPTSRSAVGRRTGTRKNRTPAGTNASAPDMTDSFELPVPVQVTKVVQVTTTQGPPASSGSSMDTLYDPAKHKLKVGNPGLDPRAMGYQAEIVGGDEMDKAMDYKFREKDMV